MLTAAACTESEYTKKTSKLHVQHDFTAKWMVFILCMFLNQRKVSEVCFSHWNYGLLTAFGKGTIDVDIVKGRGIGWGDTCCGVGRGGDVHGLL